MPNLVQVPGIEKTSEEFRNKVIDIAIELETDPNFLMAVMSFESGGTFSPSIKSAAGSGAIGLIQFMPGTAAGLGTSSSALQTMTAEEQLDFVKKHYLRFKGKMKTIEDAYMAVLLPSAVGRGKNHVLFTSPKKSYKQNSGLDLNGDGKITVGEAAQKVRERLGSRIFAEVVPTEQFLQAGAEGTAVEMLQQELIDLGYLTLEQFRTGPGIFGGKTDAALKKFQLDIGLDGNGVYDTATQTAIRQINEGVRKGNIGGIVANMQQRLIDKGFMTAEQVATGPGIFGNRTQIALIEFQIKNSLEPTGILTDETFRVLFKGEVVPAPHLLPSGDNVAINTVLPERGRGFRTYNRELNGADQFGTQLFINSLISLGESWFVISPEIPIQYGDISIRGGGTFPPHSAHKNGREVDIRPMRKDGTLNATNVNDPSYDSRLTAKLVKHILERFPRAKILFNDEDLIADRLTTPKAGHHNHLHLRLP